MTVTSTQTHSGRGRILALLEGLYADYSARFKIYRERRAIYVRTRNELVSLTDRELADIQIPRRNIHYVATEAARMAVPDA